MSAVIDTTRQSHKTKIVDSNTKSESNRFKRSRAPWVERYRPHCLDDMYGQEPAVVQMNAFLESPFETLPNLLLVGPPGTGKTSSMWCVARAMYGNDPEVLAETVLEINASKDRKADVVSTVIDTFVRTISLTCHRKGLKKLLILDEAEAMTAKAQQLLRQLMHECSDRVHFALACNDLTDIIAPIKTLCTTLHFASLSPTHTMYGILKVLCAEKVQFTQTGVETLMFVAGGDMRNAINIAQSVATTWGVLSAENIKKVTDKPPIELLRELFAHCFDSRLCDALAVSKRIVETGGYGVTDVVDTMLILLRTDPGVTRNDQWLFAHTIEAVGDAHLQCLANRDDALVLSALIARLCIESRRMRD